jgi:branched chain amino acid efflux pump
VQIWREPVPVALLILTTLMVNLRHVLLGAAIAPYLKPWPTARTYLSLFFLSDEIWALALRRALRGELSQGYYAGLAATLYVNWLIATILGTYLGRLMGDPARYGLDFAFAAIFLILLRSLWRGRLSAASWGASAAAAILAHKFLPAPWYIIIGGVVGTMAALVAGSDDG